MNRLPTFLSDPLLRPLYESFGVSTGFIWDEFAIGSARFEFDPPEALAGHESAAPVAGETPSPLTLVIPDSASFPFPLVEDLPSGLTMDDPPPTVEGDVGVGFLVFKPAYVDQPDLASGLWIENPNDKPQTATSSAHHDPMPAIVLLHDGLTLIV